jgi:YedE family putative selenium metabolism protein
LQRNVLIIVTGAIVAVMALALVKLGNPQNMGFCIACFLRDIAGGLGLHRANVVQYIRPELIGLVLGAFLTSIYTREYRSLGGSSTFTRFVLGFFVMIGMLVFLGCPLRMLLRISAGDLNAVVGLVGLVAGVLIGVFFLRQGFSLGRATAQNKAGGYFFPLFMVALLVLLLTRPPYIFFSAEGPGSLHAGVAIALGAGLIFGILAQRTRLCLVGGIRDFVVFGDFYLLYGFLAILVVALIGNLALGSFHLGLQNQPIAHSDGLWNFLGMALGGFGSALLGGCPLRQMVSASEGNADSAVTVMGLLAGAAFAHNFGLAASAKGVTSPGQIAVIIGFAVILLVGFLNIKARQGVSASGS